MVTNSEIKADKYARSEHQLDRISNLPDAVINHICSSISTIEVVRTCVLARRWKHIWTEISNLEFDDSHFPLGQENAFVLFVYGVLDHYKAPRIEKIYFSIQHPDNADVLDDLVKFGIHKNVNELRVEINADMSSYEPFEMLWFGQVKHLSLELGKWHLIIPHNEPFTSLETLSFSSIIFIGETNFNKISYPSLKSLSFDDCKGLHHLNVDSHLLQNLEIKKCAGLDHLSIVADQLQFLSVRHSFTYGKSFVKISAPSLQSFTWLDYIVGDVFIGKFMSLNVARVSLVCDCDLEMRDFYLKCARYFLNQLAFVECLEMDIACFWGLSLNRELLEGLPNPTRNLKKLKCLVSFDHDVFRGISCLFKCCPNLQTLEIQTIDSETNKRLKQFYQYGLKSEGGKNWKYESHPLLHLQNASIIGFRGKEHEIKFVEFLLDNSVALKKMTIMFTEEKNINRLKKASITQRLGSVKCLSHDAVVNVS